MVITPFVDIGDFRCGNPVKLLVLRISLEKQVKNLFVILVYDFNQKRVSKALKITRKYLHWVQNSVFEGEISKANFVKLKMELENLIHPEEDSVIFYTFRSQIYSQREELGLKKGGDEFIL